MNSLKEADVHENLFASNKECQLEDTILDEMLNLNDSQTSGVEGSRLLSVSVGPLGSLNSDSSSKLFHQSKLEILDGHMDQFFDCAGNKMASGSDALLSGISEGSSFVTLEESPTNSDSPRSPQSSMQNRGDEFNLSWDNVHGFPTSTHMIPQNSIYQFSGYDTHGLTSRRASLPENDIVHFTQFPDTSNGRKRVVSWADLDSHSFDTKGLERSAQHTSQSLHARRFSLHLPVQSNNVNLKLYYSSNEYSEEYSTMDLNLRNQLNFPIGNEPGTKVNTKMHPYQGSHVSKSKSKEHLKLTTENNDRNQGDSPTCILSTNLENPLEILDEFSDSNIDIKDHDPEEDQPNQTKQPQTVVERRLSRRRERNRLAARRSREKRNQFLRELEQVNQSLNNENGALKASLCEALRELQILRAATASNTNITTSSTSD